MSLQQYTGAKIEIDSKLYNSELKPNLKLLNEMPSNTIIATTTFYKDMNNASDKLRAGLAYEMMRKATQLGYSVVVVDGKSDNNWRQKVKDLGIVLVDEDLSKYEGKHFMGRSRRQCLDVAANYGKHPVIVWIEPEKHPMVEYEIAPRVKKFSAAEFSSAVYEGKASIVVPRRLDHLRGYPLQQQTEELTGNLTVFDIVRGYVAKKKGDDEANKVPYLDLWVGPRAISRDSIDAFLQYSGTANAQDHDRWESIFNPVISEMLNGRIVRGVAVDYVHPKEQTQLEAANPEFSMKRVDQLVSILNGVQNLLKERDQQDLDVIIN